jgi:peptidoglycan/xylan/chitin deacetylase (PgdA/CDA1 family)
MGLFERLSASAVRRTPFKPARLRAEGGMASFTFDDFPRSAWSVGGPILAGYGARATYYASGTFCGRTEDGVEYYDEADLRAIKAAGHEIACHTFSHGHGPAMTSTELQADVARNAEFLRGVLGEVSLDSFAYPYGDVSFRTKGLFARSFPTSRGIQAGVNGERSDLAQLKAFPMESRRWDPAHMLDLVERARASGGWLIFFSHDVCDHPSPYGATPAMLEHALEAVTAAGLKILPVNEALAAAQA